MNPDSQTNTDSQISPGLIQLREVTVVREGRTVLRDLNLELTARTTAVVGANGSGKSTFARLLNGLITATEGEVRVHGIDADREGKQLRKRVGMVFSNPATQIIMPTVREDLAFTLRGRGLSRETITERVEIMLDRIGLADHADRSAHTLSGGQQQLLALGAVLIAKPSLIIADEPTALLDLGNARQIARLLLEEAQAQVVLVTHDLELAAQCEDALCFEAAQLVHRGEPEAVVDRYVRGYA